MCDFRELVSIAQGGCGRHLKHTELLTMFLPANKRISEGWLKRSEDYLGVDTEDVLTFSRLGRTRP